MGTDTVRSTGPLIVAVLSGIALLGVGYFYLVGGLVIPGYVLIPLWILWLVFATWLIRLTLSRSWWTPVVPVTAAGVLALTLIVGGNVLGWQA